MGFESRLRCKNGFQSVLGQMAGSTIDAQDVRVEQRRQSASSGVVRARIPEEPFEGTGADRPRRSLVGLLVVGAIVYFAVMGG